VHFGVGHELTLKGVDLDQFDSALLTIDHVRDSQTAKCGIRDRGGIPIIAYHPRREDLSPEALLARGYEVIDYWCLPKLRGLQAFRF
jgi:hypothetical protein